MSNDKLKMTNILLETGTNELEIVEFTIGEDYFGINVAKVREIIRHPDKLMAMPKSHSSIEGVINLRGAIVPVVHLAKHLDRVSTADHAKKRIIIAEFNKMHIGFSVDSVTRIHRLSWKQVEAPSGLISGDSTYLVAVIKMENRIVCMLDYEKITSDINPSCGMQHSAVVDYHAETVAFDRTNKTVLVAEDSSFIASMIIDYLTTAGYKTILKPTGQGAWEHLLECTAKKGFTSITEHVNLVISDIEMPIMDGLHLIKNIRDHAALRHLPCIIFSSMISEELSLKCKAVGANDQITKPEIAKLVSLVDKHLSQQKTPQST